MARNSQRSAIATNSARERQRTSATRPEATSRLLVSLATGPFLLGLVAGRALEHLLQDLGKASEELFRGDRLPVLPLEKAGREPPPS
jgi:hypothetical protein